MKKFIVALAIAGLISGAALAQSTTVVSSVNIVGYAQTGIPPGGLYQLAGLNFIGTNNTNIAFSELFGTNVLTKNNISGSADKVHLYVPGTGYIQYYQRTDGSFRVVGATTATNPIITSGNAFWLQSPSGATLTNNVYLAGWVPTVQTNKVIFNTGLRLFTNPYSTDLDVNSTNLNWVAAGATANNISGSADKINIYNSATKAYTTFYLRAATGKWHLIGGASAATNAIIPVAGGAWYDAKKTFTNSFVRPYSVE